MAQVAFLGLGVMGFPMAGHLAAKGHRVTVWNRTPAKAEAWVGRHGHQAAATAREAAHGAEFVMACVGNDDDLRQVVITSVDQETGKTISQMPDEMSIKLRLYMRDALEKMDKAAAGGQTQRVEAIA